MPWINRGYFCSHGMYLKSCASMTCTRWSSFQLRNYTLLKMRTGWFITHRGQGSKNDACAVGALAMFLSHVQKFNSS